MRASQILNFQSTASINLRRPWQTFKDGQLWYGFSKTGSKRHRLTTKQGNKHYYKGTGSSGIGSWTSDGRYILNWDKVRTFVVPTTLNSTNLKALVSPRTPEIKQQLVGYNDSWKSPELALDNIVNFVEHGENYSNIDLEKADYLERIVNPKFEEQKEKTSEN
ncbi:MRPL27 [[Candida] subhashii]|uniref:MRPL27 n=1 Tax=[Candida] subhashii TaxID=561895 RepID=A0A8J5QP75_9ASCO|nr:MRPL27 [[Candida] subhashii]KAG7664005.1 MRPL27 [[Candida] subhashii]